MVLHAALDVSTGQGWAQVGDFGAAFALSAAIGLERELKQRSAGVRTYTVVGFASALFVLVGKYGFTDVLVDDRVTLDPSRVAAQIVSGLGFIGAGIIFVRRDAVRGLTTAASIWLTAAIGAAAGAGLVILAALATAAYFVAISLLPPLAKLIARHSSHPWPTLRVRYLEQRGLLREVLATVTGTGFVVADLNTRSRRSGDASSEGAPAVEVSVTLGGRGNLESLVVALSEIDGVLAVRTRGETGE